MDDKLRSALIFFVGFAILHFVTYYIAGIIAQLGLGAAQYYPPSPDAISFLRDPRSSYVQSLLVPSQLLRGILFGLALYPFRRRIMQLGQYYGGLAVTAVIFIVGEIASAGGIIERFVYYTPIPPGFVIVTFFEVLIHTLLLGQLLVLWEKRFNKTFYSEPYMS